MITVSNVSLTFGGQKLFSGADLKFMPGNCYGVIGANGAGKSTFLRILSGELEPTSGEVWIDGTLLTIEISDKGRGIADIPQAMEPFFTTHPEQERSGMGFAVMQTFMDDLRVTSTPGQGTTVRMKKRILTTPIM